MGIKEVKQIIKNAEKRIDLVSVDEYLHNVTEGSYNDVLLDHALYYHYLPTLISQSNAKQIVEMGSAGGTSALMILSQLKPDQQLIACTIQEPEGEFRFIKKEYPQLTKIVGDDLDLSVWGDLDLSKTDIWFIDTLHTYDQLTAELKLYDKFFKKGALVFLDDVDLHEGMKKAWDEIKYPKLRLPHWHSYSGTGFGVFMT